MSNEKKGKKVDRKKSGHENASFKILAFSNDTYSCSSSLLEIVKIVPFVDIRVKRPFSGYLQS